MAGLVGSLGLFCRVSIPHGAIREKRCFSWGIVILTDCMSQAVTSSLRAQSGDDVSFFRVYKSTF